ncbi:pancreatic secretory granule membrane major glycoprotein GP2-like [Oculina patagonica]
MYRSIVALSFLILCQMFCVAEAQSCRNEYSASGMTLKGHTFSKTKANNWPKCVQACNDDVVCQSVNYVISEGMCELNNRTKKARPDDFVPGKGRVYMTRLSKRVPLGSTPALPAVSCAEIKASEGENADSGNYWLDSIIPGEAKQVPCNMLVEECYNYQALIDGDRKTTYGPSRGCDRFLGPAWFRFLGDAGTKMPTTCVPNSRCGTHASGWLNATHPTVEEDQVTRPVCFSYANCCQWAINIQVRNCGDYFVYRFSGTPPANPCHLRYCGTD